MTNPIFSCPVCGQLLGDIPPAGTLTAVCAKCRLKFQVRRGRVVDASMRQIVDGAARVGAPVTLTESHELRLELPNGRLEFEAFARPHAAGPAPARTGDIVSLVYLMRGGERMNLLSVHNAMTGQRVELARAGRIASGKIWIFAGVAGVTAAVLAGAAGGAAVVVLGVAAASFFGVGYVMDRGFTPRVKVSPQESAQLTAAQQLLAKKLDLETACAAVVRELDSRRELRERLGSLRAKMMNVGPELYAARITALDRALATVDQQMALEARLRDGYTRSIQMLEIELEAGADADALDASAAPHIAATLADLHELEEQQADLRRQLAANAEVEGMLRGAST